MRPAELIRRIEAHADPAWAAAWDLSGVQVAGGDDPVDRLAVTLDPTPAQVAAALDWGAQFVLSHHPLTLSPRLPAVRDGFHDVLRMCFRAGGPEWEGAWLYAAHTSLDSNLDGPVAWLGRALGLTGLAPLEAVPGQEGRGAQNLGLGFVGDLPEVLAYADWLDELGRLLGGVGREYMHLAGPEPKKVGRVACCPGSGASLVAQAFAAGAEVFVTGDVKYHQAQDTPLALVDVGHFALEEEMMRRFAQTLEAELATGPDAVAVRFFPGREPLRLRESAHRR